MNVLKKLTCLVLIFLFFACNAWTQNETSLFGTVADKNTQGLLAGITIEINPGNVTTLSDTAGTFRFTGIRPGTYNLQFSGVGYQSKLLSNVVLTTGNITTLNVELDALVRELENITITGKRASVKATTLESPLSIQRLTTEEIKANPGGNFDISKVIQTLPGVGGGVGGGSFRNDIVIRGGAPLVPH